MPENRVEARQMSPVNNLSDLSQSELRIEARIKKQREATPSAFGEVLADGLRVLTTGAAIVTRVMIAPTLGAAVAGANVGMGAAAPVPGLQTAAPAGATAPGVAEGSELATMQAMQRESQVFNMQLLELQEQVQQENRRFTTLSNVLRAKHDTAKAAVSNIRS